MVSATHPRLRAPNAGLYRASADRSTAAARHRDFPAFRARSGHARSIRRVSRGIRRSGRHRPLAFARDLGERFATASNVCARGLRKWFQISVISHVVRARKRRVPTGLEARPLNSGIWSSPKNMNGSPAASASTRRPNGRPWPNPACAGPAGTGPRHQRHQNDESRLPFRTSPTLAELDRAPPRRLCRDLRAMRAPARETGEQTLVGVAAGLRDARQRRLTAPARRRVWRKRLVSATNGLDPPPVHCRDSMISGILANLLFGGIA